MSVHGPLPRLNEVKDMVLDWPDGRDKHPYLFMDLREMEAAGQRHAAALGDARDVEALRKDLDALSAIDLMRHVIGVACRYDAIIDSALISPQDRALFKAQAAFLAYQAAGAFHWSFERGYCSGNPNMTVSRIIGIGILGCALRDHPMGKTWAMYAIDWAKYWLAEVTDEKGGWPESSHYARVSWADLIQLAIVARRAGYHDFFADPKFLEMGRFYEKTLMPADPLHRLAGAAPGGAPRPFVRVTAPYGRGTRDDAWGLSGLLARATSATDPAYSRMMQWSWRESGFVEMFCHTTAGLAALYAQRDLPAQPPDWRSEFLPSLGYLLRSHVGTPFENYLLFVSQYYRAADGEIWPADTGGIAKWFARGQPVGGAFPRYPETSHALLENRVLLACNWDPETGTSPESGYVTRTRHDGFASLPGLDYVSAHFEIPEIKSHLITMPKDAPTFPRRDKPGLPPFQWQRQLLYVRDTEPQGPTYIVLRDTVRGGQPTQWHFWTLSQKMGTPEDAAQRDTFLRDRPGNKAAPLRALHGNRFTALGQFDMDLEYYVAAPIDTPRYTLRYGISGGAYGVANFDEYQDLLHLQLPGDGCYFVAMFPRSPKAEPPEFTTLGEDGTLRISGTFGTDYCFLESSPTEEEYRDVSFNGTAGIVQDRLSGLVLTLAASGTVRYREYELSTSVPVSLKVAPYALSLDFPSDSAGGTVSLRSPERWSLVRTLPGVRLDARGRHLTVTVPTGVTTVQFRSRQ
jgi:hypothetical protein